MKIIFLKQNDYFKFFKNFYYHIFYYVKYYFIHQNVYLIKSYVI